MSVRRFAPWPDFAGNVVHEGDVIRHPSGQSGLVVFLPDVFGLKPTGWRVDYGDGSSFASLQLQIGDKGQAVVVNNYKLPVAEYKINTDEKLAVDLMVYWQPIATCPRNAKVQLLGKGGVPAYGTYSGSDPFWTMWCPLPRIPKP